MAYLYMIYDDMLDYYKNMFTSKIYHVDGKINTNRYCQEKYKLGRNIEYKSINSIILQSVIDDFGIPFGFSVLKGSDIKNYNHLKKSNKHKKILQVILVMTLQKIIHI